MIKSWYDDPNEVIFTGQGSLHTLDGYEPDYDVIAELRAAVEEITGKPVESKRPGFGFMG